ncbi:LpqB family beta-propeller domain-containing protein [Kribbella sp. CA-293567]|uniref:LpqB family beta-propeller domain-containing protein n=1 Tax=Kribbella sp. CA-293567 TaxID=3002436 RepID=UPI0022DE63CC|nr:LpqB family beta-propeller domain-containing protein [Kribbella sp. CA-293567]WBQ03953.1 LpqB family beta-propeller domain-containing protein [Kribbella sp. CA-293567]
MKRRLLTTLLATALLAAGCATVPAKGPIRGSSQDAPASNNNGIGVEARPPRPNAEPLQLVNGFLEAMSDSRAFDVAREYMTAEAAGAWKPESQIMVYDQSASSGVSLASDGVVQLSAPLIATIDSRGTWTPAPAPRTLTWKFALTEVSKELRIVKAPPGVFLGSNQLDSKLTPRALYFFNPSKRLLVPDPVFLPFNLSSGQAATQLVQELLKGPTGRLGNGVVSLAPPGTTVNVSVPVENGVATVALSDTVTALTDPQDREKLAAQITRTLRPITDRVRITVEGAPLLPDQEDVLQFTNLFSQYDPSVLNGRLKDLYGLRNGKIQRILGQDDGQTIEARPMIESPLYSYSAQSFAVSLGGATGAIVTTTKGGRPSVVVGSLEAPKNEEAETAIAAEGKVLRPSYDNEENLWILDRANGATPRLRVRGQDGKLRFVQTKFDGATPIALRMAPDGVRALLVVQSKGVNSVLTATVETNDQEQLVLGRFKPLQLRLADITDAAWSNTGVLVAGKALKGDQARPWQVNMDGSQRRVIPGGSDKFDAVLVASNPNIDTLPAVQDSNKQLHWQGKDLTWIDLAEGPEGQITPVYPG